MNRRPARGGAARDGTTRRSAARGDAARGADPFAGVVRVLVDGSNLAYALAREAPARGPAAGPRPNVAVIAAVRATFPPGVRVEVVFDGTGDVGTGRAGRLSRAASNLFVEHSGRVAADRGPHPEDGGIPGDLPLPLAWAAVWRTPFENGIVDAPLVRDNQRMP